MGASRRFARDIVATICAWLVVAACGGETDEQSTATGGSGGGSGASNGGSGGSGGSTNGGSGGATTGGSGGAAGSAGAAGALGVQCGGISTPAKECAAGEYCCSGSCISDDTPCTGYAFHCDDAADCPGAMCCVTKLSELDGGTQVAQCQPSCDADSQLVVCNYANAETSCPSGMTCEITATLPPAYGYCCPAGGPCSAT